MNHEVIVTCAVTGAGDTVGRHPAIPVTPKQIAAAAIEAAKAGATVAHCHVRDPQTGKPSRNVALYREVVERIRESDTDVIINLTAGMGGDLEIGAGENPMEFGPNTDLVGPLTRLAHVEELLPEICTLDCGTLNFGDGDTIYVSTPAQLRAGAKRITELGVKAELEIFDTGHLWFAKQMIKEGLLEDPLFQLCLGIPWGAPADTTTMKAMVDNLPANVTWAGFGIGRMQMPMAAQAETLQGALAKAYENNPTLTGARAGQQRLQAGLHGRAHADGLQRREVVSTNQQEPFGCITIEQGGQRLLGSTRRNCGGHQGSSIRTAETSLPERLGLEALCTGCCAGQCSSRPLAPIPNGGTTPPAQAGTGSWRSAGALHNQGCARCVQVWSLRR